MANGYLNAKSGLYEGPGTHHGSHHRVGSGRKVEIIEEKGEWTLVRVLQGSSSGKVGWILSSRIEEDR